MNCYEVLIEDINPCGGAGHAKKDFIEVETDNPMAYVEANKRFPIIDSTEMENGDVIITTGDGSGNMVKYTFSL